MAQDESDAEQRDETPVPPKRAKKKKKKRKRASEPASSARPELDADGRERARFLLDFPKDPELEPLITAFESGDYATVRRDAPALAERTEDAEVRDAALELARRIEPDPLMKYLLLASVVLLVFLTMQAYFGHGH